MFALKLYIKGIPSEEPHVVSNVRYIAFAMKIIVVLTPLACNVRCIALHMKNHFEVRLSRFYLLESQ